MSTYSRHELYLIFVQEVRTICEIRLGGLPFSSPSNVKVDGSLVREQRLWNDITSAHAPSPENTNPTHITNQQIIHQTPQRPPIHRDPIPLSPVNLRSQILLRANIPLRVVLPPLQRLRRIVVHPGVRKVSYADVRVGSSGNEKDVLGFDVPMDHTHVVEGIDPQGLRKKRKIRRSARRIDCGIRTIWATHLRTVGGGAADERTENISASMRSYRIWGVIVIKIKNGWEKDTDGRTITKTTLSGSCSTPCSSIKNVLCCSLAAAIRLYASISARIP